MAADGTGSDWTARLRWDRVKNASGEIVPPYAVMQVSGIESDGKAPTIVKPINNDFEPGMLFINSAVEIPIDGYGQGTRDEPTWVLYDTADGTPTTGSAWGTGTGSWKLRANKKGFLIWGGADSGRVLATNRYQGAIGVTCVGTNVVGTFTSLTAPEAEIFNPADLPTPLSLWLQGIGGTMYEDIGGTNLAENLESVRYWRDLSASLNHATGATNIPRLQIEGGNYWIEVVGATDALTLGTPLSLTGPFVVWTGAQRTASTFLHALANASSTADLAVHDSNIVYLINDAGSNVSAAFTGTNGVPVLWRWRRDASNVVKFAATGMAEVTLGTLSGTATMSKLLAWPAYTYSAIGNRLLANWVCPANLAAGDLTKMESYISGTTGLSL